MSPVEVGSVWVARSFWVVRPGGERAEDVRWEVVKTERSSVVLLRLTPAPGLQKTKRLLASTLRGAYEEVPR